MLRKLKEVFLSYIIDISYTIRLTSLKWKEVIGFKQGTHFYPMSGKDLEKVLGGSGKKDLHLWALWSSG